MLIDPVEGVNLISHINKIHSGFMEADVQEGQFSALILNKFDQVNEMIKRSENLFVSYMKGENVSTHDLMISMGKAKHELQLIVEIRNKLLESYQELTRIQL